MKIRKVRLETVCAAAGLAAQVAAAASNAPAEVSRECRLTRARPPAIVCPADAERPVTFAASELSRYLGQILGADVPVASSATNEPAIALGVEPDPELGAEGYVIQIDDTRIAIRGGGPAGVVYGAYEFLRRFCGCRFSNPAPDGEHVPAQAEIRIPAHSLRRKPLLWCRGMQIVSKTTPQSMLRQIDWMAKIGLNYVMTLPRPGGTPSLGSTPGAPEEPAHPKLSGYDDVWFREQIVPALLDRGMSVCMANHNFYRWIPPRTYFAEHPEWFAMVDGERQRRAGQMCLCTSNREMVDTMIANIKQYLRENPEARIVGVCPEDGYGCCQCEACRALDVDPNDAFRKDRQNFRDPAGANRSLTKRYALLVNEVARALRPEFPGVRVYYAAYVDLSWPPEDVTLEPNVVVMLSFYWRCGVHLIAPDACAANRSFHEMLRRWHAAHAGPLLINDYLLGMNAQRGFPYPMAPVICRNWPIYRALGVGGGKSNSYIFTLGVYGLNYMAFGRSGWEESVDYPALRAEFLEGLFGAAAPAIEPVYRALDKAAEAIARGEADDNRFLRMAPLSAGCLRPSSMNIGYFMEALGPDALRDAVARAETLAATDREKRQVARFRDAVTYWILGYDYHAALLDARDANKSQAENAPAAYDHVRITLQALMAHADRMWPSAWAYPAHGFPRQVKNYLPAAEADAVMKQVAPDGKKE